MIKLFTIKQLKEQSLEMEDQEIYMRETIEKLYEKQNQLNKQLEEQKEQILELSSHSIQKDIEIRFQKDEQKLRTKEIKTLREDNKHLADQIKYLKEEIRKTQQFSIVRKEYS